MTQYAQNPYKNGNYTLAGDQLHPFERIVVATTVDLPDEVVHEEGDERVAYRAARQDKTRRRGISLPWALLLIMATVAIMASTSLRKAQTSQALRDEFTQLQNKYLASEQERVGLEEQLNKARDSSFISYYASQRLGMKLALNEETIQVLAPDTRPLTRTYAGQWTPIARQP